MLRRAQVPFERFTQGACRLELRGADAEFVVRDARSGATLPLEALSGATRVQLLLALRLAGIEAGEAGGPALPLLLDETLSTTDPLRFELVASSLLEVATRGRQLFYFAADPGEVLAWQAACAARGLAAPCVVEIGAPLPAKERGRALGTGHVPPLPQSAGHDAASYAEALGLPAPDVFAPASAWHLWHVLFDELALLESCLRRGIGHIGLWRSARRRGVLPEHAPELAERVELRIRLLEAVLHGHRVGRGRPLDLATLEATGTITATFIDAARDLLAEHARAPKEFVAALRELRGFRQSKADELERALEQSGHLDHRAPLTEEELLFEALAQVAPNSVTARDYVLRLLEYFHLLPGRK